MSIWEDPAGSGGSESNEKLLIDPWARDSTRTFMEPRDAQTPNTGYNSPLRQPTNEYDSTKQRAAMPALRMDEIPSDIQVIIRKCRESSLYAGVSVSVLAGLATIALKTSGHLKNLTPLRYGGIAMGGYLFGSFFSFNSCVRANNVGGQVRAWQRQMQQEHQQHTPPAAVSPDATE